jgi:hypothetical protein
MQVRLPCKPRRSAPFFKPWRRFFVSSLKIDTKRLVVTFDGPELSPVARTASALPRLSSGVASTNSTDDFLAAKQKVEDDADADAV